jgi:hypothetical protein
MWVALAGVVALASVISLSGGAPAARASGPQIKELPFESRQVSRR